MFDLLPEFLRGQMIGQSTQCFDPGWGMMRNCKFRMRDVVFTRKILTLAGCFIDDDSTTTIGNRCDRALPFSCADIFERQMINRHVKR